VATRCRIRTTALVIASNLGRYDWRHRTVTCVVEKAEPFSEAVTEVVPTAKPLIRTWIESMTATDTMVESADCKCVWA
jgi:hypothetical protein